jgi:hypothetical protein
LKQFLSSWPSIPYWRIEKPTDSIKGAQRWFYLSTTSHAYRLMY